MKSTLQGALNSIELIDIVATLLSVNSAFKSSSEWLRVDDNFNRALKPLLSRFKGSVDLI